MSESGFLPPNDIYQGDVRDLLPKMAPESLALSFWSPPYFVGKSYEEGLNFRQWQDLLSETIADHFDVIAPGGLPGRQHSRYFGL